MIAKDFQLYLSGVDRAFVRAQTGSHSFFDIELDLTTIQEPILVEACPIINHRPPCPHCCGMWPGTKMTDRQLTQAVNDLIVDPDKLGCGTLTDRTKYALRQMEQQLFPDGV